MQFLTYFSASIISFLGLLTGILLVKIAPEEQRPLEQGFSLLRKILLLLIFIFLVFFYVNSWFFLMVLAAYFVFLIFLEYGAIDKFKKSIMIYSLLGTLFFLSSKNANLFAIESSLILLYGAPAASLLFNAKENNYFKVIFYNIGFVVIANLLFFMQLPFLVSYS